MQPWLPSTGSPKSTIYSVRKVLEGANYGSKVAKMKQVSGAGDSKRLHVGRQNQTAQTSSKFPNKLIFIGFRLKKLSESWIPLSRLDSTSIRPDLDPGRHRDSANESQKFWETSTLCEIFRLLPKTHCSVTPKAKLKLLGQKFQLRSQSD